MPSALTGIRRIPAGLLNLSPIFSSLQDTSLKIFLTKHKNIDGFISCITPPALARPLQKLSLNFWLYAFWNGMKPAH
ncbi:MAG: hypothetical protein ACTS73_09030 [Arsenophonus sp. NEOnobi-MAG3]